MFESLKDHLPTTVYFRQSPLSWSIPITYTVLHAMRDVQEKNQPESEATNTYKEGGQNKEIKDILNAQKTS